MRGARTLRRTVASFALSCGTAFADDETAPAARWPASEPIRLGMAFIRDKTIENYSLVTHRRMSRDAAMRFARDLRAKTEWMRERSIESPEAAAEMAAILDDIVKGADAVAGVEAAEQPVDGIIKIDRALKRYAARFHHPGWESLRP